MCCPEAGSRPGTNVALPFLITKLISLHVAGDGRAQPPPMRLCLPTRLHLHETPVAAALIDSSAFIRHEHSTASSNNTSTTTKFPSSNHIRSWDQTKPNLPSLLYFPSSNQIRWAPIHNMQIDKHQQLQLQFSSPPRGAPSSTLPSPGCRRPSQRAIVSEFLNKSLESDFFLFTWRDAGAGATHGSVS